MVWVCEHLWIISQQLHLHIFHRAPKVSKIFQTASYKTNINIKPFLIISVGFFKMENFAGLKFEDMIKNLDLVHLVFIFSRLLIFYFHPHGIRCSLVKQRSSDITIMFGAKWKYLASSETAMVVIHPKIYIRCRINQRKSEFMIFGHFWSSGI